jgi:hypothetical protein
LKRNFSLAIAQKVKNVMHKNVFFIPKIIRPVFGRFCPKMAAVRPQIFPANHLLFWPVLSYFAEFSAGWQQWTEWLGGGGGGPQTLLPASRKYGQITQNRPNNKMTKWPKKIL